MHQKLRRLDATKSSSRSIVPSQLLHRQAQRRQKQRAPMSTSLPYLRLALDNRLQDVFVDVGDSNSSSNTANSSSDSSGGDNSYSKDASSSIVLRPLRGSDAALAAVGLVSGFASGLLGIGGGTVVTPLLAVLSGA